MKDYLVLVNKDNAFNEEENEFQYIKDIPVLRGDNGKNTSSLELETYNAFLQFRKAMDKKGIIVEINSALRTVEDQIATEKEIYEEQIAKGKTEEETKKYVEEYVAKPGHSEHHTGLAIDCKVRHKRQIPKKIYDNSIIRKTIIRLWNKQMMRIFRKSLSEFGFIKRYNEKDFATTGVHGEDWHIRFVGDKETAKDIEKSGLCLEDYVELLKKKENTL